MQVTTCKLLGAACCAFLLGFPAVHAAAPAKPTGYINFRTYAGDQRAGVRNGTATIDGSYYPKRMEGPYNGFPGPDPGDDDTPPNDDYRNNYNMELVGYFYPPKTGKVQFAICTDDPGELYFSTDDNPANKVQVAAEANWNPVRNFLGGWTFDPSTPPTRRTLVCDSYSGGSLIPRNWSPYIDVVAGKAYFIQAIGTEYGGGDNTAVAYRYQGDPDFEDKTTSPTGKPIPGQYLSPFYPPPTNPVIVAQPKDAAVYDGGTAVYSVAVDVGLTGSITSTKWTKNGVDIPNSNSTTLSVKATVSDDGAKVKAIVSTSGGVLQSSEATLTVAQLTSEFATGVVKFEAWRGISGTPVDNLLNDAHYADPPDDVRLLGGIDSPNGYADNYGARLTGFIIAPSTGDFDFFIRSDDASRLYLSNSEKAPDPNVATPIAEETGCCNAFMEPGATQTTATPIPLVAGKKYAFMVLVKEGGGGDYVQVAMRKTGDTTAASALAPISGSLVGANAKPSKGDVQITRQPTLPATLEAGRTYRLTVDGIVTPTTYNYPLLVQWQKNGANIAGATSKTYIIKNATSADAGTYRAVLSSPSGKTVNSTELTVTAVTPDTFPPVPTAGALLKNGKQEIGVGFDEEVDFKTVNVLANYALSAGTIDSIRVVNRPATGFDPSLGVKEFNGIVLVASGLTPGQSYNLTVKNVADLKGNKISATGTSVSFKAEANLTWSIIGNHESKLANADDVIRTGDGSFEVMSSGVAFWADYDEGTFVNQKVKGDFDAKVQLIDQDPSSQWARCGLQARERLDEGKARVDHAGCDTGAIVDCQYCVPKANLFSRLHDVHANSTIRWDAGTSNNGFENHYRDETTYAMTWGNQLQSVGIGVVPAYPDVWMRLQRSGNHLITSRGTDGQNWVQMVDRTFPDLAGELYVGMGYLPELLNNGTLDGLKHGVLARYRNYSITIGSGGGGGAPQFTKYTKNADGTITIEWTGGGTLQAAAAIVGPWQDVAGAASPYTLKPSGAALFGRIKQ